MRYNVSDAPQKPKKLFASSSDAHSRFKQVLPTWDMHTACSHVDWKADGRITRTHPHPHTRGGLHPLIFTESASQATANGQLFIKLTTQVGFYDGEAHSRQPAVNVPAPAKGRQSQLRSTCLHTHASLKNPANTICTAATYLSPRCHAIHTLRNRTERNHPLRDKPPT